VKSKVSMSSITIKNKNVNSAFDIKGMKLKSIQNVVIEKLTEKIELDFFENIIDVKKKKYLKKKN
jgi:hypothetical protein